MNVWVSSFASQGPLRFPSAFSFPPISHFLVYVIFPGRKVNATVTISYGFHTSIQEGATPLRSSQCYLTLNFPGQHQYFPTGTRIWDHAFYLGGIGLKYEDLICQWSSSPYLVCGDKGLQTFSLVLGLGNTERQRHSTDSPSLNEPWITQA